MKKKTIGTKKNQHITNGIRCAAFIGGSGLRSARSFRYAPFPRLTAPTFCKPWSLLRKALIRVCKTSYT